MESINELQDVNDEYAPVDFLDTWDIPETDPADYAAYIPDTPWLSKLKTTPSIAIPQFETGTTHELNTFQIASLPVTGAVIDGTYCDVSGPQIDRPEYIAQATVDFVAKSTLRSEQVIMFPKWNGRLVISMACAAKYSQFSILFDGKHVQKIPLEEPWYGELMSDGRQIAFDGHRELMTQPIKTVAEVFKMGNDVDGVILQVDNNQYRLKFDKTYDLKATKQGFAASDDAILFTADTRDLRIGDIYEVSEVGKAIRPREDKRNALSTAQIRMVQAGLTLKQAAGMLDNVHSRYSVIYHMSYYIWYLYQHGQLNASLDIGAVNLLFKDCDIPYSADELLLTAKKLVTAMNGQPLSEKPSDKGFYYVRNVLKPLTLSSFLSEQLWTKLSGFTAIKRRLLELGYFFTVPDLSLLFRKFLRLIDKSYYFTPNKLFRPHLFKMVPCHIDAIVPDSAPNLLPYHAAFHNPDFFNTHVKFDVRVKFTRPAPVIRPPMTPAFFNIESSIMRLMHGRNSMRVAKIAREVGWPRSIILDVVWRSEYFQADEGGKCVLHKQILNK